MHADPHAGLLTLVHDELSCLTQCFGHALQQAQQPRNTSNNGRDNSNSSHNSVNGRNSAGVRSAARGGGGGSGAGSDEGSSGLAALRDLVWAVWGGAVSALQLLALHQAGFRPLTPEVRRKKERGAL